MQVIGGEMTSWNANPRKRPHDREPPGSSKRSFTGPGASGAQSRNEDIEVADAV